MSDIKDFEHFPIESALYNTLKYFIQCDYCKNVIEDPFECVNCAKKYCKNCIKYINSKEIKECSNPKFKVSQLLKNILNDRVKFKCQYDNNKHQEIKYSELKEHHKKEREELTGEKNQNKNNNSKIETNNQNLETNPILRSEFVASTFDKLSDHHADLATKKYKFEKYHEHYLEKKKKKGWKCNICLLVCNEYTRFRCEKGCDFDVCELCMNYYGYIAPFDEEYIRYQQNSHHFINEKWKEWEEKFKKKKKNNIFH